MNFSKIYIFVVTSLLIHFIFMGGLHFKKVKPLKEKNDVEITVIEKPEAQKLKKQKLKQIVEQAKKPVNQEAPDDEAFLSRFNQRVKKEVAAQKTGSFNNSNGQNGQNNSQNQAQQKQKKKKSKRKTFGLSHLVPKLNLDPKVAQKSVQGQKGPQSQTDDYLKNLNPGIETVLNTREFLYYSYYARIKEKIRQHWGVRVREKVQKLFKKGRTLASTSDHITRIVIILNKKGVLEKVLVKSQSGIHDLDQAAVEAFRAAAPFPNPPKGMIEKDGKIRINWDFILEA